MNKLYIIILILIAGNTAKAQEDDQDSLKLQGKYLEDQLYLDISYNVFIKQPKDLPASKFSYGISAGYIRDIPIVKNGKMAIGLGIGYAYDSFTHYLVASKHDENYLFSQANSGSSKLRIQNLEMPLQFRLRTSDSKTYSFWRMYLGIKISYNLRNNFISIENGKTNNFSNINPYNKFQTGLTLSAGYGTFNFYMYYGLTPIFKSAFLNQLLMETKVFKLGLSFYLL